MRGAFGVHMQLLKYPPSLPALENEIQLEQGLEPMTLGTTKTCHYQLTKHSHVFKVF